MRLPVCWTKNIQCLFEVYYMKIILNIAWIKMMLWTALPFSYCADKSFREYCDDCLNAQKNCGDISWNWLNFQISCWKSNYMHFGQFSSRLWILNEEPALLFRYMRRYWDKPLLALSAQYVTQLQLFNLLFLEELKLKSPFSSQH